MLQRQWVIRPGSDGSFEVDGWDKEESSIGQRALSLSTHPGIWTVVPVEGKARAGVAPGLAHQGSSIKEDNKPNKSAPGGGGSTDHGRGSTGTASEIPHVSESLGYVIPLRIGDEGVVLEGRMHQGEFRELLRAPCQIVNTTAFTMEACLVTFADSDWTDVGIIHSHHIDAARASPPQPSQQVVERVVLGRAGPGDALPLPLGWQQFGRQLLLRPVVSPVGEDGDNDEESSRGLSATDTSILVNQQTSSSGREAGGDNIANLSPALHDWSIGATDGRYTLRLDDIDEGITRLVSCAPLAATSSSSSGGSGGVSSPTSGGASLNTLGAEATSASLEASTLWFSITVESEMITSGTKRGEPLVDWRIVVAPPLTIANQLPTPGGLIVWEHRPEAQGQAIAKLSERVPSGGIVPVHTANMSRVVSFTLYPDGYDWAEASPAVLSTGVVRVTRPPPDRFRLMRPGSRIPVEVFLQRDYQIGPWIADSHTGLDPGMVVARGVPLGVTLLAPLWIVNGTGVAIDAAVVPIAPPPQVKLIDIYRPSNRHVFSSRVS